MFLNFWAYDFFQNAIIVVTLIGILAPTVGIFFVIRRLSGLAAGVAHLSLLGAAIAVLLGWPLLPTTIATTLIASASLEAVRKHSKLPAEAILTLFTFTSLALAAIIFAISPAGRGSINTFLLGSIFTISATDIYTIALVTVITLVLIAINYKALLSIAFDEPAAIVAGLPVHSLNYLLMGLGAITISVSINAVGALLIGALMVIPVISALQFNKGFVSTWAIAVIIGVLSGLGGILLAGFTNLPGGPCIAIIATVIFILVALSRVK